MSGASTFIGYAICGHFDYFVKMTGHSIAVKMTSSLMTDDWSLIIGHFLGLLFTHRTDSQAVIQSPIPPLGGRCNDDRMTSSGGRWELATNNDCANDTMTELRKGGAQ